MTERSQRSGLFSVSCSLAVEHPWSMQHGSCLQGEYTMKTPASVSFSCKWRRDTGFDDCQNSGRPREILEVGGMSTGEQQKASVQLEALVAGWHLSQGVPGERVWRHKSVSHLNISLYSALITTTIALFMTNIAEPTACPRPLAKDSSQINPWTLPHLCRWSVNVLPGSEGGVLQQSANKRTSQSQDAVGHGVGFKSITTSQRTTELPL